MVFGQTVKVVPIDIDRYGRTVALIIPSEGTISLNEALVRKGFAWVYRKYCKADFCLDWIEYEATAKESGLGLWADPEPIPPWQFRRQE